MKTHKLVIKPDATMICLYDDAIRPLIDQAKTATITRISNVKTTEDTTPQFYADLAPVGGPVSPPFRLRSEAIAWEVQWANEHVVK